MEKYEYIDHTADLKVKAYGKTLEEAFVNAAVGGFDFIYDTSKVSRKDERKVVVESKREESLLYDFLEELLFLLDSEKFFFCGAKDIRITKGKDGLRLEATVVGDKASGYKTSGDIKAITYSEMKIEKVAGGFTAQVVFDI
jgi:SHS2 domain-containing protein